MVRDLPDPFRGVSPFAETKEVLRNQPSYTTLQTTNGPKEVPVIIAGRVTRHLDRWLRLDPKAGAIVAGEVSPNWANGVRPPPLGVLPRKGTPVEEAAKEDLLREYELLARSPGAGPQRQRGLYDERVRGGEEGEGLLPFGEQRQAGEPLAVPQVPQAARRACPK